MQTINCAAPRWCVRLQAGPPALLPVRSHRRHARVPPGGAGVPTGGLAKTPGVASTPLPRSTHGSVALQCAPWRIRGTHLHVHVTTPGCKHGIVRNLHLPNSAPCALSNPSHLSCLPLLSCPVPGRPLPCLHASIHCRLGRPAHHPHRAVGKAQAKAGCVVFLLSVLLSCVALYLNTTYPPAFVLMASSGWVLTTECRACANFDVQL